MNSSQFMDKQIMDLSRSQSQSQSQNNNDPIYDLLNPPQQEDKNQKDDILPSYDFQPIRPVTTTTASNSSLNHLESTNNNVSSATRVWNSADSKPNHRPVQNHIYQDPDEVANFTQVKDHTVYDASILSEIDQTMKKHADILLHSLEVVSARLSQMETRTRNLENTVDHLKVSVENDNGSTDGKLRQLENILREVQTGVQVLRDKQEIAEAQLNLAKFQTPKFDQSPEKVQITPQSESIHQAPLPPPPPQHVAPPPPPQQIPVSVPPNALPNPPPLQNQPPVQQHPQREHYFQPPGQIPDGTHQQYQLPPTQQLQSTPPIQPQQHYQPPPQFPQYSQAPPPQQLPPPPPPLVGGSVNPSILPQMQQPPPDEATYIQPPQSYPPSSLHRLPSLTQPPTGGPPSQQYYGPPPPSQMYDRPNTGFSQGYGEPSYPYGGGPPPSQYGKLPSSPSAPSGGGGGGYPRLPTAQILPQAIPTANSVASGGGSSSSGTQNRVPIDDVVDKVSTMGFSREQVRATVRKLTENGQSVDLNVVLDKLMNDGEIQPQKGWFGR